MKNPFLGAAGEGREGAPTAFTPTLARAQICCQVNSGAISYRQEKILQIPPEFSYRQEFRYWNR